MASWGRSVTPEPASAEPAANRVGHSACQRFVDYIGLLRRAAAKAELRGGTLYGRPARRFTASRASGSTSIGYQAARPAHLRGWCQGGAASTPAPREFSLENSSRLGKDAKIRGLGDEIQPFGRTTGHVRYAAMNLGLEARGCLGQIGKMTQACATLFTEEYNPGPGLSPFRTLQ